MSILIACEESQIVTIEFRKLGFEAYSCDLYECSGGHPEWHLQQDVTSLLSNYWDLIIAFPPCTYLSNAGIRWFNEEIYGNKAVIRKYMRELAMLFVLKIYNANSPKVGIENPVGYLNSHWKPPDQIIHPYYFGDPESKRTCLWLRDLPLLKPTNVVKPKIYGYFKTGAKIGMPIYGTQYCKFSEDRAKLRSKTFPGIGKAMAEQWAKVL